MTLQVFFKTRWVYIMFMAHIASKWLFSWVNSQVDFQMTRFLICFVADSTYERLFFRMTSQMSLELIRLHKTFLTNVTFKRFQSKMKLHVNLQLISVFKCFTASHTCKWFFIRMTFQMSSKISCLAEIFLTYIANKSISVCRASRFLHIQKILLQKRLNISSIMISRCFFFFNCKSKPSIQKHQTKQNWSFLPVVTIC